MGGQVFSTDVEDADQYSADTVKLQLSVWLQYF